MNAERIKDTIFSLVQFSKEWLSILCIMNVG